MGWIERLEELRREERQEQPVLQLPLPSQEPPPHVQPEDDKQERGVTVIEFAL